MKREEEGGEGSKEEREGSKEGVVKEGNVRGKRERGSESEGRLKGTSVRKCI